MKKHDRRLRIGLLGCGPISQAAHLDAIRKARNADLYAICDIAVGLTDRLAAIYLALARFRKRPLLGQLPRTLQRDMRAFFGTYTKACQRADKLLFRAGDAAAVDAACQRSPVGKLLP